MTRKTAYRYVSYIGKEKCPKCHEEGYLEKGTIMGQEIGKTLHKQYEPIVQYARIIKVCYW